jgi:hypothetical protein
LRQALEPSRAGNFTNFRDSGNNVEDDADFSTGFNLCSQQPSWRLPYFLTACLEEVAFKGEYGLTAYKFTVSSISCQVPE